jgi:hypothetical protein
LGVILEQVSFQTGFSDTFGFSIGHGFDVTVPKNQNIGKILIHIE